MRVKFWMVERRWAMIKDVYKRQDQALRFVTVWKERQEQHSLPERNRQERHRPPDKRRRSRFLW